jgi:hypothetical protein
MNAAEETFICLKCGRICSLATGEPTGEMIFDDHARDKIACKLCKDEMDRETWSVRR